MPAEAAAVADDRDHWRWHRFVKLWARSQLQTAQWAERYLPKGNYYRLRIEDLAGHAPVEKKARAQANGHCCPSVPITTEAAVRLTRRACLAACARWRRSRA